MHRSIDRAYLQDGIRRIEAGEVQAGSHAAGIFGRCAAAFEVAVRAWFARLLGFCGLKYEQDIKAHCKGLPFEKTTLGNLIAGVECAVAVEPERVGLFTRSIDIPSLLDTLRSINKDWVRTKHHEEIDMPTMLERMKAMEMIWAAMTVEAEP